MQTIDVIFENVSIPASNGNIVGQYLTHPAFTSFNNNGMWVGKFETGYKGATTPENAKNNVNQPEKIQIKPNVYAWNLLNPSNAHLNSYHYERNLDSHMMKNMEWGCVAYLSQSKYGINRDVRINNNSNGITGNATLGDFGGIFSFDIYEGNQIGSYRIVLSI